MAYTDTEFLNAIRPMVIADMQSSGILASLTAAQAFIESNKGNSGLTTKANNLFGMKGTYNGQYVVMKTKEYLHGQYVTVDAKFRKYPSWAESIADHSALFNRLARYANLRGLKDYQLACKYVKDDGYATSPTYTQTLLAVIEKYKLYEWDNVQEPIFNDELLKPTLKKGDHNEYVASWQRYLISHGYDCGKSGADGIFGNDTEKAVVKYQQNHNIEAGYIGPLTWQTI